MGMYDTVWFTDKTGEERDIQFKCGECSCRDYQIGHEIDLADGIYFGHEGCFVVYGGSIVAAFHEQENPLINKWGGTIAYPELQRW